MPRPPLGLRPDKRPVGSGDRPDRSSSWASLREPPFRRVFVGQVASNIGSWFQSLAESLLLLHLGGSATQLGALVAVQFAPLLVLGGWTGSVVDRVTPRRILLLSSLAQAALTVILGVVTLAGRSSIALLFGISFGLGVAVAFERPAVQLLISELVPEQRLANAVSLFTVSTASARLIGPAAGGLVYGAFGPAMCFLVNAVSFAVLWVAVRSVRPRAVPANEDEDEVRTLRRALRYLAGNRELATLVGGNAIIGLLAFNFMTTVTALASLRLHGSATEVGLAHAGTAVGAVLGGLLASRSTRIRTHHVAQAAAVLGLALAAMAMVTTLLLLYLLTPVLGMAISLYQARSVGFVQLRTPRDHRGQVFGLMAVGSVGTTAVGATLCGWLISQYSVAVAFEVGAASCVATALAILIATRFRRRPDCLDPTCGPVDPQPA